MKHCPRCKTKKNNGEFGKSKIRTDGLQPYCKICTKEYRDEHYQNNKEQYLARTQRTRNKMKGIIRAAKDVPCVDCGKKYPYYVMDFDHLGDKLFNVGEIVKRGSYRLLQEEIAKCEIVCANCHRIRTHHRSLIGEAPAL